MNDNQNLSTHEPLPGEYETMSRDDLKARLTIFIADLLESSFEKLCHMVYRHDVSEEKFHEALQSGSAKEQAENIAELVIERELQKVEARKAYRRKKHDTKDFLTD